VEEAIPWVFSFVMPTTCGTHLHPFRPVARRLLRARKTASRLIAESRSAAGDGSMPKMRKKSDLPTKTCAVCGLPFMWRKKWAKVWEDVKYCSDRCRNEGKPKARRA
jgi:hypothetical protein